MADGTIALDEPATVDKLLDTEELTVGANTVQRERVQIAGAAATEIAPVSATLGLRVNAQGPAAHDAAAAGNPVLNAGYASAAAPTDVSADGDVVRTWHLRNGSIAVQLVCAGALIAGDAANGIDVDVTRSALPTGASTLAEQQTQTTHQAAIRTAVEIIDDWDESDRAKVNPIAGQAGVAGGAGAVGATTQRVVLATDTTVPNVTGNVAHDGADSGNPVKIGGRADTTFQTAAADGDRVDALFDVYGVQEVRSDHPNKWSYHADGSSALTDASVQAAPGAGLSVYITDIIVSLGAASALNVFFEEGASKILGPYYLEAINGRSIHLRLATPKKCTANTAVTVTTSAAVAHAVDVMGFIAP